jgi:hypothetical protein
MRAVKHRCAMAGNPGASLYRCRWLRRHGAANVAACASSPCARHASGVRRDCADTAWRSRAVAHGEQRTSTPGCNTADRGRSANTTAPERGNARTGTSGLSAACPPRRQTEGAGRARPSSATLRLHRLHRHGVGRGAVFAARRNATAAVPTYFGIVAVVPRSALMTGNAEWGVASIRGIAAARCICWSPPAGLNHVYMAQPGRLRRPGRGPRQCELSSDCKTKTDTSPSSGVGYQPALTGDAWQTDALRDFRDAVLRPRPWGRRLVAAYYRAGPRLGGVLLGRPPLLWMTKCILGWAAHGWRRWSSRRRP